MRGYGRASALRPATGCTLVQEVELKGPSFRRRHNRGIYYLLLAERRRTHRSQPQGQSSSRSRNGRTRSRCTRRRCFECDRRSPCQASCNGCCPCIRRTRPPCSHTPQGQVCESSRRHSRMLRTWLRQCSADYDDPYSPSMPRTPRTRVRGSVRRHSARPGSTAHKDGFLRRSRSPHKRAAHRGSRLVLRGRKAGRYGLRSSPIPLLCSRRPPDTPRKGVAQQYLGYSSSSRRPERKRQ